MKLTFVTDLGQTYTVEIDPKMRLEDVMALLEAESGLPPSEQSISYDGRELNNAKATMEEELGPASDVMLLLRRKISVAGRTVEQDAEMIRLQILGDPNLMRELHAVLRFCPFAFHKPALLLICYRPSQSLQMRPSQILSGSLNSCGK